ncbi:ABC transporter substrate-binding protein [Candidatus Woesearchaeota archaeon]|nr:ABC transporter substrate-binding protein [Candidatus Woesearchaeota archaeon]
MKQIIYLAIALLILLTACATTPTGQVTKEPVKIGATMAMTGKYASYAIHQYNGMLMALEKINSEGGINGRELKVIIEDNKGEPKEAVTGVHKLMTIDSADVIFSAFTHITMAVKDVVVDNGKFLFYQSTHNPIAESSPYVVKDYWDKAESGKIIVDALIYFEKKKIAYIGEISDQCLKHKEAFEQEAEKKDIEIISSELYPADETDFRTIILKTPLDEIDALVTCTWRQNHYFMKQLQELGLIEMQTFQSSAITLEAARTPEMTQIFSHNKAVSAWYGFAPSASPKENKFVQEYEKRYREPPLPDALYSYDDIMILAKALRACDSQGKTTDRDCLSKEILSMEIESINGDLIKFNKDGIARRPPIYIQAIEGEWREIDI